MAQELTVSVVLCSYNGAPYISQQIDSILSQSVLPDELLVIDDGSTDGTQQKVNDIEKGAASPLVFIQNEKRLGVTKNFEAAVSQASKDIIFLSDQDDVWFPEKIERVREFFLKEEKVGLVYSDALVTDSELFPTGDTVFSTRGASKLSAGDSRDPFDMIMNPNVKGCTMAFRRDFVPILLPIQEKVPGKLWGHDHWIAFVLGSISTVRSIDEPLMYYRLHGANTSGNIKHNKNKNKKLYSDKKYSTNLDTFLKMKNYLDIIKINNKYIKRKDKFEITSSVLENEINILLKKQLIRRSKTLSSRLCRIASFARHGYYKRFSDPIKSMVADTLRIYDE